MIKEFTMAIGGLTLVVAGLLGLGIFMVAILLIVWAIANNRKP